MRKKFFRVNALMVEDYAAWESLKLGLEMGYTETIVEGDAQSIISMINWKADVDHRITVIVDDVRAPGMNFVWISKFLMLFGLPPMEMVIRGRKKKVS